MALIHVPRPPKEAGNPNRPVSSLLKSQVEHLHEAERRLPYRYHSDIYITAIKTEGEATEYIRKVTEAIHRAHEDAAEKREQRARKPRGGIAIAAVADEPAGKKSDGRTAGKKNTGDAGKKKS